MDVDYPRALLVALVAVVVLALAVAASTSSASFGTYNAAWDGASDLRERAEATGAEATVVRNTTAYGTAEPNATVAVVLAPDEPYGPTEAARLRAFVRAGGTLVVADDFGESADGLLADVDATARLDGRLLRDERYHYRSPAMPVARNVSAHPLTGGVEGLTLNHGTAVEPGNATVLIASSGYAYLDADRDGDLDDDETVASYPVATVEPVGDGRVVVLGDPSALINVMLDRPGNERFVGNLFAGSERILLDYSHSTGVPPLALAVLVLRESAALQVLLGALGLAAIGLWTRGIDAARVRPGRSGPEPRNRASPDELESFLRERHPDWDGERIRRVIRGVNKRRGERHEDD